MKKQLFIFLIYLSSSLTLWAQNQKHITGTVVESENAASSAPYANVLLYSADNNLIEGVLTDENGDFKLDFSATGELKLKISYVGYTSFEKQVYIGDLNDNYDVGNILLQTDVEQLKEVVVEGEKQEVITTLEKKTFNIAKNISQQGGSVLKAIKNLPGVTTESDGTISLRGNSNVLILIDGKQSSLTGFDNNTNLDNIPAGNVEKIEIINNPSAKFDANGKGGIINIVYKKEKQKGLNGDVGLSFGVGEFSTPKESLPNLNDKYGFNPSIAPNVSLNYRTDKINYFIQADGMVRSKLNANTFTKRDYYDPSIDDVNSQFLENRTQELYNIKGGMDWHINDNNVLTAYGLFQDEYHIDRGDVPYDNSDGRERLWLWEEDERTKFMNFSLMYHHDFNEKGHTLDASYNFIGGGEDELFMFSDSSANGVSFDSTFLKSYEYVNTFKLDYVKPLGSGRLESGLKANLRHLPITYEVMHGENSILDDNLGEYSDYYENVYSAYFNYIFESKKVEVEAGLRAEMTYTNYTIDPNNQYYDSEYEYHYFQVYPNVRFTYKLDDNNKISTFYNKRVRRPGEFELRPFPKYDDPELLRTGNPNLRPEFSQNFEVGYNSMWSSGSLYVAGYYKYFQDVIARIYTQDPVDENVLNGVPTNLDDGSNLGVEIILEQEINDWWTVNTNFNWYQNKIGEFNGTTIYPTEQEFTFEAQETYTWNFKLNTTFKLPNDIDFQLSGVYYAPDIIPQGEIEARYSLDFGISKAIFKNKGEISITGTDILNSFKTKTTIYNETFLMNQEDYQQTQSVVVGMKYRF